MISIGIDVAEARKGLDLVALDDTHTLLLQRAHATVVEVVNMIADLRPDVVCIDSPPNWALDGRSRVAERQLRTLGITAFSTPVNPGAHAFYEWMRVGFSIFDAIADAYPRYRDGPVRGAAAEVFPEASAVLLAGRLRGQHETKGHFRRRVLADHSVDIDALKTIDAIDAALAALTGILALNGVYSSIGSPDEGVIVVPVASLPNERLRRLLANVTSGQRTAPTSSPSATDTPCLCGCGAIVRRRFLPGHDSKLKSRLISGHSMGDATATAQLSALGWLPE